MTLCFAEDEPHLPTYLAPLYVSRWAMNRHAAPRATLTHAGNIAALEKPAAVADCRGKPPSGAILLGVSQLP